MSDSKHGEIRDCTADELFDTCKVVLLYGDQTAKQHAEQICGKLVGKLRDEVRFEVLDCEFGQLKTPAVAQSVADSAVEADIVIFTAASSALPAEVHDWLQTWQSPRAKPDGVIGLLTPEFHGESEQQEQTVNLLAEAAHKHQMDFISSEPIDPFHVLRALEERAEVITPLLKELMGGVPGSQPMKRGG